VYTPHAAAVDRSLLETVCMHPILCSRRDSNSRKIPPGGGCEITKNVCVKNQQVTEVAVSVGGGSGGGGGGNRRPS